MVIVLTLLALLAGLIGFVLLTDATTGVGIIALGCLAGILARIIQAKQQQDAALQFMQKELEYLVDERLPEQLERQIVESGHR